MQQILYAAKIVLSVLAHSYQTHFGKPRTYRLVAINTVQPGFWLLGKMFYPSKSRIGLLPVIITSTHNIKI